MELLIKLYDEIDDLIGPLFAMASAADILRGVLLIASVVAALALDSLLIAAAGFVATGVLLLVSEQLPFVRVGRPRRLRLARQAR